MTPDEGMTPGPGATDVAIVGMGAVFPGAGDAPAFWRNIRAGTDAITEVPPDRWDPAVYCDPAAGDGRWRDVRTASGTVPRTPPREVSPE